MAGTGMAEFWDRRAREDAFHYVDNRERFGSVDQETFWRGGEEVIDNLLATFGLELRADQTVVEVGCGVGRLTRVLASRARFVHALDVSREMVNRARELNPRLANVDWLVGDGTTLAPVADASCDACVSFVVFQHIPDPEITLGYVREMGRVLRAGGWAAFQISNDPGVHRAPSGLRRLTAAMRAAVSRGPRGQSEPEWLGSAVSLDALSATAGAASLEVAQVQNPGTQFCLVLLRRR